MQAMKGREEEHAIQPRVNIPELARKVALRPGHLRRAVMKASRAKPERRLIDSVRNQCVHTGPCGGDELVAMLAAGSEATKAHILMDIDWFSDEPWYGD